jgi:hypothetical protein
MITKQLGFQRFDADLSRHPGMFVKKQQLYSFDRQSFKGEVL